MALASPVWKNTFYPPGQHDLVGIADFSGSNAKALLVPLCIAHLQFEDIPSEVSPEELLIDIVILCDRYLCHGLLKPWVKQWMKKWLTEWPSLPNLRFKGTETAIIYYKTLQAYILIGSVFWGRIKPYYLKEPLEELSEAMRTTRNSRVKCPEFPAEWPLPPGILEKIVDPHTKGAYEQFQHLANFFKKLKAKIDWPCETHNIS